MLPIYSTEIQRLVRVVSTKHSCIQRGMVGIGVMKENGWEVTFENLEQPKVSHEKPEKKDTTIWFKFGEVEIVG